MCRGSRSTVRALWRKTEMLIGSRDLYLALTAPLFPATLLCMATREQLRQAARIGAAVRKGDSDWGRWMRRRKGTQAMRRSYPTLWRVWAANGNRARWGLPLLPVPSVEPGRVKAESEVRVQRGGSKAQRGGSGK